MTPPEQGVFEYRTCVTEIDIDILNHVNNLSYLRWSQDAAFAHWKYLTAEHKDIRDKNFWVIARNEVDYLRPAFLNDKILIHTWVGETKDAKSVRHVKIYNEETQKVLAQISTTWCFVDLATLRSKLIDEKVMEVLYKV